MMTERERLIELLEQENAFSRYMTNDERRERLADYLLENGVKVPLVEKFQNVFIHQFDDNNNKVSVVAVVTNVYDYDFDITIVDGRGYNMKFDDIGKSVFLTKAESEKSIKGA